jgi:hypothetical protein
MAAIVLADHLLKFRSMVHGADRGLAEISPQA